MILIFEEHLILIMKRLIFSFLIFSFSYTLAAQTPVALDTVYLMSGKTVAGVVKDSTDEQLKILIPRKGNFKADFIDLDLVYSVKYSDSVETVFYKQDTLFGNYFTDQEMRYYLQGERDARRSFRSPLWSTGAFVAGFGGSLLGGINFALPFIPPFAYAGLTTAFLVRIRPGAVSNPNYLRYDTYLLGFEKEAKKHRIFRSLIWGGAGMIAGMVTNSIIASTSN